MRPFSTQTDWKTLFALQWRTRGIRMWLVHFKIRGVLMSLRYNDYCYVEKLLKSKYAKVIYVLHVE